MPVCSVGDVVVASTTSRSTAAEACRCHSRPSARRRGLHRRRARRRRGHPHGDVLARRTVGAVGQRARCRVGAVAPTVGAVVAYGSRSTVHELGTDAVAKVPLPETAEAWIRYEAEYSTAVRLAGAPVPEFLGFIEHDGRIASVYRRARGPVMWDAIVEDPASVPSHATDARRRAPASRRPGSATARCRRSPTASGARCTPPLPSSGSTRPRCSPPSRPADRPSSATATCTRAT